MHGSNKYSAAESNVSKSIKDKAKLAEKQARWWKYLAWTLPLIALAIIITSYYIGTDEIYKQAIAVTTVVFFSISAIWWWWALFKLVDIVKGLSITASQLSRIKYNLTEFKKRYDEERSDRNRKR